MSFRKSVEQQVFMCLHVYNSRIMKLVNSVSDRVYTKSGSEKRKNSKILAMLNDL